jgi:hypothetical protein
MRDLLYRLPRFSANFPVDVIVGEIAILGTCKNISNTGMRGDFRHRLPVGTEGILRLNHPQQRLEVKARVAYVSQLELAFNFLFQSEAEMTKMSDFARAVTIRGSSLRTRALPTRGLRYLPVPPDRRL